ncbi:hypothetical protein EJP82_02340 [Paenibacillus anaericanus]|uniref:SIR2-like domain-containing protein n=1 Tax=Paenibacillus anaericanus TaxID=170367 RepID=A0A3S1DMP7_9BACL|nr:hypothetical protein [Paenibacillus anaericanus]RUT48002.1 hypothetical protein EJP82_02340 [Paenibacillus anaericanus]
MKNILVGNGINIQFGGSEYLNSHILNRAVRNVKSGHFPADVYPSEVAEWLMYLFSQFSLVINGLFDNYAVTESERTALADLKKRYRKKNSYQSFDIIGFEDYFLVHNLVCVKEKIVNPERYNFREVLRIFILDSIYNAGNIEEVYHKFPFDLLGFLRQYDNIFTTNYDKNIEKYVDKEVFYLHGAFHILADVYDPNSLRNHMSDSPLKNANIITGFDHLYSNALTTYSGESKEFLIGMQNTANEAMTKFLNGIKEKPEIIPQIEEWKDSDSSLVRNLYEAIKIKQDRPDLTFLEFDAIDRFREIEGSLTILGLSPNNDNHIFNEIRSNEKLDEVIYYYYDNSEGNRVNKLFDNKKVKIIDVKKFWKEL